ncbi:hypothetical protein FQN52_006294 [Onygenales sp. PD_12]|nr:hypothetical protein FQN52_006294 [Onygenales sp. PD_12]
MSTAAYSASTQPQQQGQSSASSPEPNDPTAVLLTYLSSTSALEDLHSSLLSSLQRVGWTEQVRGLALELLRAGHCERFEEVIDTIVALATGSEDVTPSSLARGRKRKRKLLVKERTKNKPMDNGQEEYEEVKDESEDEDLGTYSNGETFPDIRIPQTVVAEGVKMLHESLDGVFIAEGADTVENGTNEATGMKSTTASSNHATNGATNGSPTTLKKPPPLKHASSAEGKSRLKSVKSKPQENGDARPEKKAKRG